MLSYKKNWSYDIPEEDYNSQNQVEELLQVLMKVYPDYYYCRGKRFAILEPSEQQEVKKILKKEFSIR